METKSYTTFRVLCIGINELAGGASLTIAAHYFFLARPAFMLASQCAMRAFSPVECRAVFLRLLTLALVLTPLRLASPLRPGFLPLAKFSRKKIIQLLVQCSLLSACCFAAAWPACFCISGLEYFLMPLLTNSS